MFEVGQTVVVTGITPYGEVPNCKGVLIERGIFHDWLVAVTFPDGSHDDLGYDESELAETDAAQ